MLMMLYPDTMLLIKLMENVSKVTSIVINV
jgi:hypothetical protein